MLGPLNWIGFVPLGIGLLWAIHLLVAGKHPVTGWVVRSLQVSAAVMVLLGLTGPMIWSSPLGWVLAAVMLVVFGMSVARYRTSGARQLLTTLAYAAEHGLPLADSARSFAYDRTDELGRRAWHLADQLDQGMSLGSAIAAARLPATTSTLLFARLGHGAGPWHSWQGSGQEEIPSAASSETQLLPTIGYLGGICLFTSVIVAFTVIKVVPTYQVIMQDFELGIPMATQWLIGISETLARPVSIALISLGVLFSLAVGGYLLLRYLGWIHFEPWGLRWLERPYHGARVAGALGTELRMGRDLPEALQRLQRAYPTPHVADEICEIKEAVGRGTPWPVAFTTSWLFHRRVQPLLEAAQALGNVPWALTQLSQQLLQRTEYRRQLAMQWLTPILIVLMAIPIAFIGIALLFPIFQLVSRLA